MNIITKIQTNVNYKVFLKAVKIFFEFNAFLEKIFM